MEQQQLQPLLREQRDCLGPAQLALQIHESTGHALELDRILGDEAASGPMNDRPAKHIALLSHL
jgi:hypothetical protein